MVQWLDLVSPPNHEEDEGSSTTEKFDPETNQLEDIEKQFDKFAKSVVSDYQTQASIPEDNLKLPRFIIDSFSKLFLLWYKNPVFKNSLPSDLFYDVFSSMFRSLNNEISGIEGAGKNDDDSSELTAICEICDQQFTIRNNDAKSSYAEHLQTDVHVETLNTFQMIRNSTNDFDLKEGRQDVSVSIEHEIPQTSRPQNENYNKLRARYIGKKSKNGVDYFCHLCKCAMNETYIDEHEADRWHRYQVKLIDECYCVLEKNRYFLELVDEGTFDFECHLCDFRNRGYTRLIEHCRSKTHNKFAAHYFQIIPYPVKENQIKLVETFVASRAGGKCYCELCKQTFHTLQREKHLKEAYHNKLESDAHRVAKIPRPYIHKINQRSEICVCELCDMKFSAVNGIVLHCKTRAHVSFKNFANEITTVISKMSTAASQSSCKNVKSVGSSYQSKNKIVGKTLVPKNMDDNFIYYDTRGAPYCHLCMINLSNKGNVITHVAGAKHKFAVKHHSY